MNKDLNGGYGTADDFGSDLFIRFIGYLRKKSVKIPKKQKFQLNIHML